jgi:hypothetical protein
VSFVCLTIGYYKAVNTAHSFQIRLRKFIGMRMKQPKSLHFMFRILLLAILFTTGAGLKAVYASKNASDTMLVILQPEDPSPSGTKLSQRFFTGDDYETDCAYYELLLKAQRSAAAAGADVLQIVSRSNHSRAQRCDGIEVAFYRTSNPREAEQSFSWNPARRLTWEDFRGGIRRGVSDRIAAETSCGIAIETNLVTTANTARIYVFNTFDKRKSWVRPGHDNAEVLEHEQGHWDICELYTRKMQARFDAAHITGANLKREVSRIYDATTAEYVARQEQYEQETSHGTIPAEQRRWTMLMAEELSVSPVSKL